MYSTVQTKTIKHNDMTTETQTTTGKDTVVLADDPNDHERLLAQITAESLSDEERLEITERFSGLVGNVLKWAEAKGMTVDQVRRLGGGFKNPVLMLTSSEGKSYVAKAFVEADALTTTQRAQRLFEGIAKEDEHFIPSSEFGPDSVLFSAKAEGEPVRSLLEECAESGEVSDEARSAFFALGATLGTIHERTEKPITSASEEDDIEATQVDVTKIKKHLSQLEVGGLLGVDDEQIEGVLQRVGEVTAPEYVSLVHADAHLDQFFYAEDGSLVEIVDYDDIREGDPMADLGRVLSSLRDWSAESGADFDTETELTRSIITGYESTRHEDFATTEGEMDYMRVVAYELRLRLVQLKQFDHLREYLLAIATDTHLVESDVILTNDESIIRLVESQLTDSQVAEYKRLQRISKDLNQIISYLTPVRTELAAA